MIIRRCFRLLLIILVYEISPFYANAGKYVVDNYNLMDELSLPGSVWAMTQDTNGILFFASDNGIICYDGTDWMNIPHNNGAVRALYRSRTGQIYYGAVNDFGIISHDIHQAYCLNSFSDSLSNDGLNCGDIWSICETDQGVFFQSDKKLFLKSNDKLSIVNIKDSYHRGFVYMGQYYLNQKGVGLTQFDGKGFVKLNGGGFFQDKIISAAIHCNDGSLLIGTRSKGVYRYAPETGTCSPAYPLDSEAMRYLRKNNIYHAQKLPNDNIAFASLYGGTIVLNKEGDILTILNRNNGLNDNVHYYLYYTDDSNLWMCTSNGISAWNIHSPFIYWDYTQGIDGIVLDIDEYDENVFVASMTGLYSIPKDYKTNTSTFPSVSRLLDKEIWELCNVSIKEKDFLLIGTGSGLYMFDGKLSEIRNSELVLKILQLKKYPDLILAFMDDAMDLYRWNGRHLIFERRIPDLFSGLRTVAENENGQLWVGSRKPELINISLEPLLNNANTDDLLKRYKMNNQLTDVFEYDDEIIFSNANGLKIYNPEADSFEKCYLFGPHIADLKQMFSGLDKDFNNNIWVGGNQVFLYHADGCYTYEKLHFYEIKEVFSAFVFYHENEDNTWIGGKDGVYLFCNKARPVYPINVKTLISEVELNSDSVLLHINNPQWPYKDNEENLDYPLVINLARKNSQICFRYSLPYFNNEEETRFSFRLKNYSEKWSEWTDDREATFSNLPPGDYLFEVRALCMNMQMADSAQLAINIPFPWYRSFVAILFYLLGLALIVYFLSLFISRRKVKKQIRIEDIVKKRIQENRITAIIDSISPNPSNIEISTAPSNKHAAGDDRRKASTGTKSNAFIEKALGIIDKHLSDPGFGVEILCNEMNMNQAKVYRRMISLTGMSINGFIRNTRLKRAAQLLIESEMSISEVAYETGFSSPSYFTRCFKNEFGKSPREFLQQNNKI